MINDIQKTCDLKFFLELLIDPVLLVITFILGFVISNIQRKRKNKAELNSLFEFFILYLAKQQDSFQRQLVLFSNYLESLKKIKPYHGIELGFIVQPYELLEVIDKVKLIQSFKQNKISENKALSILTVISFFKENIRIFSEAHNHFIDKQNGIGAEWNLAMMQFHQEKVNLLSLQKKDILENEVLIELNRKYNDLLQAKSDEPFIAYEVCIKPLNEYFSIIFNSDHLNKTVLKLMPLLQKLDRIYNESLRRTEIHSIFLNKINELMKTEIGILDGVVKQ
jgi:hypothetical protein